jgi:hypothetical protein
MSEAGVTVVKRIAEFRLCRDCRDAIVKGDGVIWLSAFDKKGGVVEP